MLDDLVEYVWELRATRDDRHVLEVLGRGADQARPPMSICSIASANVQSGRVIVASKG